MKDFADRLREARVAAGLTQEQLGFSVGVSKSSVSAWENGRETPSFRLLPALRLALQVTLDELICAVPSDTTLAIGPPNQTTSDERARDKTEHALLLRFRALPAARRRALLDLLRP